MESSASLSSDESDSSFVSDSELSQSAHEYDIMAAKEREDPEGDGSVDGGSDYGEDEDSISDDFVGEEFRVSVKRVGKGDNDAVILKVNSDDTVWDLKLKIRDELEARSEPLVPAERQRLIFSGRMLRNDDGSLADVKMKAGVVNIVHLSPLPDGAVPSVRSDAEVPTRSGFPQHREDRQDRHEESDSHRRAAHQQNRRHRRRSRNRDHPYAGAIPSRIVTRTNQPLSVIPRPQSPSPSMTVPAAAANVDESLTTLRAASVADVSGSTVCPALPGIVLPLTSAVPFPYPAAAQGSESLASLIQESLAASLSAPPARNNVTSYVGGTNSNMRGNVLNQQLTVAASELHSLLGVVQESLATVAEPDQHRNLSDLLEQVSRRSSEMASSLRLNSLLSLSAPGMSTTAVQAAPSTATTTTTTTTTTTGSQSFSPLFATSNDVPCTPTLLSNLNRALWMGR